MRKSHTDLDRAGVEKTASTAAGSEATAARAVLPGPTSQSSKDKPEIYSAYLYHCINQDSFSGVKIALDYYFKYNNKALASGLPLQVHPACDIMVTLVSRAPFKIPTTITNAIKYLVWAHD